MNTNTDSLSIVETIITLANKLKKSVVAEGIENEKHKLMLSELSCELGQGFLFSPALNSEKAEEFLIKTLESNEVFCQKVDLRVEGNLDATANPYMM